MAGGIDALTKLAEASEAVAEDVAQVDALMADAPSPEKLGMLRKRLDRSRPT